MPTIIRGITYAMPARYAVALREMPVVRMPGGRSRWDSPPYSWSTLERRLDRVHYKTAARNLRKAADMLSDKSKYAYGLGRRRLDEDVAALRLTARDVAAGAITTPAKLDGILDTTHADLLKRGTDSTRVIS